MQKNSCIKQCTRFWDDETPSIIGKNYVKAT